MSSNGAYLAQILLFSLLQLSSCFSLLQSAETTSLGYVASQPEQQINTLSLLSCLIIFQICSYLYFLDAFLRRQRKLWNSHWESCQCHGSFARGTFWAAATNSHSFLSSSKLGVRIMLGEPEVCLGTKGSENLERESNNKASTL